MDAVSKLLCAQVRVATELTRQCQQRPQLQIIDQFCFRHVQRAGRETFWAFECRSPSLAPQLPAQQMEFALPILMGSVWSGPFEPAAAPRFGWFSSVADVIDQIRSCMIRTAYHHAMLLAAAGRRIASAA